LVENKRKTFGRKGEELTADWKNSSMTGKEFNTMFSRKSLAEKDLLEVHSVNKMIILKLDWIHPPKDRDCNTLL
jgi:hypothetical protein